MNAFFSWPAAVAAALLATVIVHWLHSRSRARRRHLCRQGDRLIHALKTYSAWIESQRGEPYMPSEAEEVVAAEALANARAIVEASFPALSQALLRLLRGDSELMWRLWQQKLPALDDSGLSPAQRVAEYRQLRDEQEDLIDEMIARCQVLIGERGGVWRSTDMDSEFAASFSTTSSA